MAEDEGPIGNEGGAVAVVEVVEVGAADADFAAADEHHARRERGLSEIFDAQIVRSVKHGSLHGGGHGGPP
jgi:hypothetical protein